ncbi:MAG: hypothetical protein WC360_05295 [Opitutales bacterium]|jgi:T5SS/PEP-CTERM-associated repeat protein
MSSHTRSSFDLSLLTLSLTLLALSPAGLRAKGDSLDINNGIPVVYDDGVIHLDQNYVVTVGLTASGNSLTISNGSGLLSNSIYIGYQASSVDNTMTVSGNGSSSKSTGAIRIGFSGSGTMIIADDALVSGHSVAINSASALKLDGGYLAISGDTTTQFQGFIDAGTAIYAWDPFSSGSGALVQVTSGNSDDLVYFSYYADISTYAPLSAYGLSGSYTVLTSVFSSVPEPATCALFGGFGALCLALLRKRTASHASIPVTT